MTVDWRVEPWPNGLGADVYLEGRLLAEVLDVPEQAGIRVKTYDANGEPDLYLALPSKLSPLQAAGRCLLEGEPVDQEQEPQAWEVRRLPATPERQRVAELKARHPGMLLLLREGDGYSCLPEDVTKLEAAGAKASFPSRQLELVLKALLKAGHRVAVCEQAEDSAPPRGRRKGRKAKGG